MLPSPICSLGPSIRLFRTVLPAVGGLDRSVLKDVAAAALSAKDKLIAAYQITPYPRRLPALAEGQSRRAERGL